MKKILVCDQYTQESLGMLKSEGIFEITKSQNQQPTVKEVSDIEALLIRSRTIINESFLERASKLELIVTATSGFDHIDLKACQRKKITVMHTPDANKEATAQLTLLHILNWLRRGTQSHLAVLDKKWKDELPMGSEISQKTVGIIGLGRVGKRVAELCKAFQAKVIAFDPYIPENEFKELGVVSDGLIEVLRQSDVVTLHVPLTSKTKDLINRNTIECMSENTLLINVARGGLINENDLYEALQGKKLAAAALDVFKKDEDYILNLSENEFDLLKKESAIARISYKQWKRNIENFIKYDT
jgi:D-3-phosphoglycerate dehydrogenase